MACRQGTLTPPDTWSRPFGTCICSTCWDQSFSELVVILPDYARRISLGTFSILLLWSARKKKTNMVEDIGIKNIDSDIWKQYNYYNMRISGSSDNIESYLKLSPGRLLGRCSHFVSQIGSKTIYCYNFWTIGDRDFIFGMHTDLMMTLLTTSRAMTV